MKKTALTSDETIPAKTLELKIRATLIEDLLGTASNNPELHQEYIASNSGDPEKMQEEAAAIRAKLTYDKSKCVFSLDDHGHPCIYDYHIKGFFKDACGSLLRVPGTISHKFKSAYKSKIGGLIFVTPRMIQLPCLGKECTRPITSWTPAGEITALVTSETCPAGSQFEFTVTMLDGSFEPAVTEWLNYGRLRGLGQWRNSGKGRFTWELIS